MKKYFLPLMASVLIGAVITFAQGGMSFEEHEKYGAAAVNGAANVKNSPYFPAIDVYNLQSNENLTIIPHFKTRQQLTNFSCGPSAAGMVVFHYLGKDLHTEKEICKIMNTSTTKGTDLHGMTKYFKELGWEVRSTFDGETPKDYTGFLRFVKENLAKNTPILVENVDWGGHWRVIIGYDTMGTAHEGDDVLILADPFDTSDHLQDGYNIISAERFYYMWFDAKLFKKGEQDNLWLTVRPK